MEYARRRECSWRTHARSRPPKMGKGREMRTIRTAGLALVAALALGAVASTGASAAVPELGRCVPAETPHTGEYKGRSCIAPAEGKGRYNFIPGPGAKPKFEGTSSDAPVLEMPNLTISCSAATFNGEYTGAKTASVTVDLIGCVNLATLKKCQSNPLKKVKSKRRCRWKANSGSSTWAAAS